jgi:hypothetical protein
VPETIARISAREGFRVPSSLRLPVHETPDKVGARADVVHALPRLGTACAVGGGIAVGLRPGAPDDDRRGRGGSLHGWTDGMIDPLAPAGFPHTVASSRRIDARAPRGNPCR